ncbi:peptidoglycan recognition protein family protein [Metabacillus arenae]|uniref:N-acetylmuramoyl-L-alanine amidase n=1 Tax=Metabacillus arenae TaxID=2771434 RepID=A0A926NDN8_9BACI|nr:N-acetylmuramoyl-L-alanine amidase [Metabacillus arenae]MBD1379240.1 N-acetylmuramoyl-L-alanine amidase [Metabacillus arenae]
MAFKVKQDLVPTSKHGVKCPYNMDAEYITVHNTANDASAQSEINYMKRNNNSVSYHYAVDDKEVIQGISCNRNAWHCGDGGSGSGNRKSIGVEICYSKSGGDKYYKAESLAIKLIAQLLKERGWGINRVKKHQDWSGKYCPHRILSEGRWNSFLNAIENELNNKTETITVEAPKTQVDSKIIHNKEIIQSPNYLQKGDRGEAVKELQRLLKSKGHDLEIDGHFGKITERELREFQANKGGRLVVDGLAGRETMDALRTKHNASPKPSKPTKSSQPSNGSAIVPYPGHLIKRGSRGKDVERVQRAVGVNPDGVFGKLTESAVKEYQHRHGLTVDGLVGKNTWNTMF